MQKEIIKSLGLEVGDKVRIIGKFQQGHLGWEANWVDEMDNCIKKVGVIKSVDEDNFGVAVDILDYEGRTIHYLFPAQCLEVVSKKINSIIVKLNDSYRAIVSKDKIEVGGLNLSIDIIDKLIEARKEVLS